jgi:arabinofuranosyltransferase
MPARLLLRAAAVILSAALAAVIVRLAWVSDDAYITLRTVENWIAGHGLVWNVGERVQTYTHPLWMLLLTAGRALSGEAYFTTIGLGIGVTMLAALVLVRIGRTAPAAIAVSTVLLASRSFTEFATSGLENPASYLLLALLVVVVSGAQPPARRYTSAVLLTALLACNRLDLGLLSAPAVVATMPGLSWRTLLGRGALGAFPLLAWLAFATFYYGSPFPITAYAKAIAVGLPAGGLLEQGLVHLLHVATRDPVTMATIAVGSAVGLLVPSLRCRMLAIGVLLYCGYVVKVGGDFMAGRFYTPPFVVAVAILARWWREMAQMQVLVAVPVSAVLMLLPGTPAFFHSPEHDEPPQEHNRGIVDERLFYYWNQGLWSRQRSIPQPGAFTATMRAVAQRQRPMIIPWGMVGRYGYEGGDLVYLVDSWLLDPLLMRLPIENVDEWRIGHFIRRIPEGYLETLAFGDNRIRHPGLRRCYDTLRTSIRGPLLDGARLAATWRLLSGAHREDLAAFVAEEYRNPPRLPVAASDLAVALPAGTLWFDDPRVRLVYHGGLQVDFPAPQTARTIELTLQGERSYTLRLRAGGRELATLTADLGKVTRFSGLAPVSLEVPAGIGEFDSIWIDSKMNAEYVPAVGSLILRP